MTKEHHTGICTIIFQKNHPWFIIWYLADLCFFPKKSQGCVILGPEGDLPTDLGDPTAEVDADQALQEPWGPTSFTDDLDKWLASSNIPNRSKMIQIYPNIPMSTEISWNLPHISGLVIPPRPQLLTNRGLASPTAAVCHLIHDASGMGRYFCDHEMGDEHPPAILVSGHQDDLTHCQRFHGPLKAHKRCYSYYSRYARGNFEIPDSQFSFILSADPYPTPHLYPSVTSPFKRWSTAEFHANQIPSTPCSHPLFSPVPKRKVLAVALSKIHTIDIHRP